MKKLVFSVFAAALVFGANADVAPVETAEVVETVQGSTGFDGFFIGMGISAISNGLKLEGTRSGVKDVIHNEHDMNFAGSIALGYGKVINGKTFLGIEAGLDAGPNSNYRWFYDGNSAKISGFVPSVSARLGYVHNSTMYYLKAGAAYSQAKFITGDNSAAESVSYKCSKWSPIVALGADKICCNNLRGRFEVEYRFGTNKTHDVDADSSIKLTNKDAITLRAMAVYTFKY